MKKRIFKPWNLLRRWSRLFLLLGMFVFFSLFADSFISPGNIGNMLLQQAPVVIMLAMAMAASMVAGGVDLSVGANISLSSYVCAMVVLRTGSVPAGILSGTAIGLLTGIANGLVVSKVHLPPFLSTWCIAWVADGTVQLLSRGRQLSGFQDLQKIFSFWNGSYLVLALAVFAVMTFFFEKTVFGKTAYSIGCSPRSAAASGIRVGRQRVIVYAAGGAAAALAGLMYMANFGAAEPALGSDLTAQAFAAALAGGAAMAGSRHKIQKAVTGGMILVILRSGLLNMGVPGTWLTFVYGIVIVTSVLLDYTQAKMKKEENRK